MAMLSAGIHARLAAEVKRWSKAWGVGQGRPEDREPLKGMAPTAVPGPLAPEELRRCSLSFKRITTRVDGFHPRHYALLGNQALLVMSRLMVLMHQTGAMPTLLQMLLVQLIPKIKSVGTRPIGFLQSFLRVFGRLLSGAAKKWDQQQEEQACWSMAAGRSTVDAVWRQAFLAERAAASSRHVLSLLWDLKEAYEHVGHRTLAEEAGKAARGAAQ